MQPRDLAHDLLDLVLPVTCAGCGVPGRALCASCLHRWSAAPRRCEEGAGRLDRMDGTTLPVWALAENAGPVRRAVVAWKDRGRADVTPFFAALLGRAGAWLSSREAVPHGVLVVAAPPSAAGLRRRGEDLVAAVAAAHAGALPGARPVAALRLAGRGRDQVGLGVRGRGVNLAGRVRVRERAGGSLSGAPVVLVDDVLTTGATLAACRTALESADAQVVGAVVLAVTRPPGTPTAWLVGSPHPG